MAEKFDFFKNFEYDPNVPLSKDEQKGLLYGSLIAAGAAALSGRNVGEALQNAAFGFGVGYTGGRANLMKEKADLYEQLRQQEELRLRQLQYGLQQKQLSLEEEQVGLSKQQFEQQKKLSDLDYRIKTDAWWKQNYYVPLAAERLRVNDYFGAAENLFKAGNISEAVDLLKTKLAIQTGNLRSAEDYRKIVDSIMEKSALQLTKLNPDIFGTADANLGLQLVRGEVPKDTQAKLTPERYDQLRKQFVELVKTNVYAYLPYKDDEDLRQHLLKTAELFGGFAGIQIPTQQQSPAEPNKSPARAKAEEIKSSGKWGEEKKGEQLGGGLFLERKSKLRSLWENIRSELMPTSYPSVKETRTAQVYKIKR